jgi:hypothetical protein
MEKDSSVALELICLASNIIKKVCGVPNTFISVLKKFDGKRTHNMLALMLTQGFKIFA